MWPICWPLCITSMTHTLGSFCSDSLDSVRERDLNSSLCVGWLALQHDPDQLFMKMLAQRTFNSEQNLHLRLAQSSDLRGNHCSRSVGNCEVNTKIYPSMSIDLYLETCMCVCVCPVMSWPHSGHSEPPFIEIVYRNKGKPCFDGRNIFVL